jgi:hypothetical protein
MILTSGLSLALMELTMQSARENVYVMASKSTGQVVVVILRLHVDVVRR